MKRFAIFAATAALMTGAAFAEPSITVLTPKDPASKEQAAAYVAELDHAVKKVCRAAVAPVSLAFYAFQDCVRETRLETAKKDPTGLYAQRESISGTVIAAR